MRLIDAVYDALRSFDRPCTRAELEAATGLGKDDVWNGLKGLLRRGVVCTDDAPRKRGLYALVPGAPRPEDRRGRAPKSEATRALISAARKTYQSSGPQIHTLHADVPPTYHPASPPSHASAPGILRTVHSGAGMRGGGTPIARCTLADVWTGRRKR